MTATPPPAGGDPDPQRVRWRVLRDAAPAAEIHARDPGPEPGHQLWIHRVPRPALILGSTQPEELVRSDLAAADGIEVCRRRSGGGLVYLDPATDCWLDAIVPVGSPLWRDDVGVAFHWLGERWAAALNTLLGPAGPAVIHRPRPGATSRRRPLWCFADLGHGEVSIGPSKVVGLSQRRTRNWLRLQSLVLGGWPGRRLLPYLDLDVARSLVGGEATDNRGGTSSAALPFGIDPARVRAGPPPGVRLPAPDALIEAFLDQTRAGVGTGTAGW